jgi:hypothetical protein
MDYKDYKVRVIVAGGRFFEDFALVCKALNFYLSDVPHDDVLFIEGGAKGADRLGRKYAEKYDYPFMTFEADWDKYGKGAGYRRNAEMADVATHLVLFWDGKSKGSGHMKNIAERKELNIRIHYYH